jgi:hypothetical protein
MKTKLELIKERQEYIRKAISEIGITGDELFKLLHKAEIVRGDSRITEYNYLGAKEKKENYKINLNVNINTLCDICDYIDNNKSTVKKLLNK